MGKSSSPTLFYNPRVDVQYSITASKGLHIMSEQFPRSILSEADPDQWGPWNRIIRVPGSGSIVPGSGSLGSLDPDQWSPWIRINGGPRIQIQEGKNDPTEIEKR
jgi:hypothetical protein